MPGSNPIQAWLRYSPGLGQSKGGKTPGNDREPPNGCPTRTLLEMGFDRPPLNLRCPRGKGKCQRIQPASGASPAAPAAAKVLDGLPWARTFPVAAQDAGAGRIWGGFWRTHRVIAQTRRS